MPSLVSEEKVIEIAEEVKEIHRKSREEAERMIEALAIRTINDSLNYFMKL